MKSISKLYKYLYHGEVQQAPPAGHKKQRKGYRKSHA